MDKNLKNKTDETVANINEEQSDSKSSFCSISDSTSRTNRSHLLWENSLSEKEIYRTVVVNYHYPKVRESEGATSTSSTLPKKSWRMSVNRNGSTTSDEDDIPNLRRLYGMEASKDELNTSNSSIIQKLKQNLQIPITEQIKVEIYSLPPEQSATVESIQKETVQLQNFIVLSDNDIDETDNDDTTKFQSIQIDLDRNIDRKRDTNAIGTQVSIIDENTQPKLKDIEAKTSTNDKNIQKSKNCPRLNRIINLHRHRLLVERKRLELLDLKIVREREDMLREKILFEKDFELKASQIKQLSEMQTTCKKS